MKKAIVTFLTIGYLAYELYSDWQIARALLRKLS
jgi:hypothetical protein